MKIHNSQTFNAEIERMVIQDEFTYMEAIVAYVEKFGIEPESVNKLINPMVKEKLRKEAYGLNLLGKRTPKLKLTEEVEHEDE